MSRLVTTQLEKRVAAWPAPWDGMFRGVVLCLIAFALVILAPLALLLGAFRRGGR